MNEPPNLARDSLREQSSVLSSHNGHTCAIFFVARETAHDGWNTFSHPTPDTIFLFYFEYNTDVW